MKVAVATNGGNVAEHFGRCPSFTIAKIDAGQVKQIETIANPGHQPGFLPDFFAAQGVSVIIAGGMGIRAQALFNQKGIDFVIGITGDVQGVLDTFACGELKGAESLCPKEHGGEVEPCEGKEE